MQVLISYLFIIVNFILKITLSYIHNLCKFFRALFTLVKAENNSSIESIRFALLKFKEMVIGWVIIFLNFRSKWILKPNRKLSNLPFLNG